MADQTTINMATLAPVATAEVFDSADGRKPRPNEHDSREVNNRHRSNGSHHHHHHHSGGSETDESYHDSHHHRHRNGRRRSRSRSRSRSRTPSPSPSRSPAGRAKRSVEDGQTPQTEKDIGTATNDVEPLLVNNVPQRKISHTKSELDEDSHEEERPNSNVPQPGVDDGFFIGTGTRATNDDDDAEKAIPTNGVFPGNGRFPNAPPSYDPNIILDGRGNPQVIPDINVYQQKKNLAQGMMDLALLSANANQLRYVLESWPHHPYKWFSVVLISISLILQVAVGVGLILNSRYNVKNREQICRADKINNFTVIGIFLITIVNVMVSAFGVADAQTTTITRT